MLSAEIQSLRIRGFAIIALGDFDARIEIVPGLENNNPSVNSNCGMFKNFIYSLDLTILNTLPISKGIFTHFIEREGIPYSESILDYGLTDPNLESLVSSFVIDSEARIECGTDHSLLMATVNSECQLHVESMNSDVLNFQLPSDNNYRLFDEYFSNHPGLPSLDQFKSFNVEKMSRTLTDVIFDACCKAFLPPRVKKKRRQQWLPPLIVKHIKVRRLLQAKYDALRSNTDNNVILP